MAILNNDATNLERFLDDALHDSARLLVMVGGIAALLVWMNPGLAAVTLVAVPLMWALTRWFMWVVEPRYAAQRESLATSIRAWRTACGASSWSKRRELKGTRPNG